MTSNSDYLKLFERLLVKVTDEGLDCIIMGDVNINLLESSNVKKQLVDILDSYNFTQIVKHATRVDGASRTLIDHAYTNIAVERTSVTGVDTRPLSDHSAQRVTLSQGVAPAAAPAHRLARSFSAANVANFINSLDSIDWSNIIDKSSDNCDTLAKYFLTILTVKHNTCFPLKMQPTNTYRHWVDAEVHNMKYLLNEAARLKTIFPTDETLSSKCEDITSKYHALLKAKRVGYYSKIIEANPRLMWRVINTELGRNTRQRADFTDLIRNENGQPYSTKQQVVDALNLEFTTAASRCGAPAADCSRALSALTKKSPAADVSLRLEQFTPADIFTIATKRLASKKSTDLYGISAHLLKTALQPLAPVMSCLFNMCMSRGVYPTVLKKVKISPIYKGKGKKTDATSYRPISLVPAVSKVFEVGLNRRLLNFVCDRGVLSERQYAYRAGRTTTDLVREVVWRVLSARETGQHVALLCCDLSRAFDTADHNLIANKLGHYGIRGPAGSLLTSFMSQRTQVVVGDGGRAISSELLNALGVPQGSCLSNTLFSLLLNDLPDAIANAEIYMYADDVAAVITAPTSLQLEAAVSEVANELDVWFRSNGLVLNKEKTCFLTFNLNGKPGKPFSVAIGNTALQQVQSTKLLGFHIDGALTWETHIDELCGKVSRSCFALRRLAATATRDVVRSCYFATVHSNITYGLELWGRAADFTRAFVAQKRAIRAIFGAKDDVSCVEFFKELRILPLPCELILQIALFMHNNLDTFRQRGINPTFNLRSNKRKNQLVTPYHRLVKSERSVYVGGPAIYNRIPASVRDAPSAATFKRRLKAWLHEKVFYDIDEFMNLPDH